MADPLDAQAAAFAHLLRTAGNDADTAFRKACALADGLFPHQVEGVAFLLGRRRAILADDMGLGKTRQAIVSLQSSSRLRGPYLVVCPASVKRNWAREIALVARPTRPPRDRGHRAGHTPPASWVVVNYDVLGRHRDALGQGSPGQRSSSTRRGELSEEPHQRTQQAGARPRGPCEYQRRRTR